MREELDKKLCADFPNLYKDRNGSMQSTCMCWGFDCDDGWFDIIHKLSQKLEALIVQYLEENKDNLYCIYCTRKEKDHTKYYTFTEDGNTVIPLYDTEGVLEAESVDPKNLFCCEEFIANHPRASQVKEKYGGLRFYMTSSTDEMEKVIDEAEASCDSACEDCGKPGEICVNGTWYKTLCEECVDNYNKGKVEDGHIMLRNYIQCSKLKGETNGSKEEK